MVWFGGTLPLASTPIWGLEGWWASQGGHSAGQWSRACLSPSSDAVHGVQPPQEQLDSRSVTVQPLKATMDGGGTLFLHAGCPVSPQTANGFAQVLLGEIVQSQESQVAAFCLRRGGEGEAASQAIHVSLT